MTISSFRKKILSWYKKHGRSMPWRKTKNPYKILVSEVMLQQTGVGRVLPKYKEFLREFPTLRTLAQSSDKKLFRVWEGLGYWRRALYLKKTAQKIMQEYGAKFPSDIKTLETFPGIGPYTARAIACFAFGNAEPFLDTNIRRIYLYFFFPKRKKVSDKEILKIARKAVWLARRSAASNRSEGGKNNPREWHYALFDYGATALKDKTINKKSRHYHRQSPYEGSFRSYRTKAVRFLLQSPSCRLPRATFEKFLSGLPYSKKDIISSLLKDKILKKSRTHYSL